MALVSGEGLLGSSVGMHTDGLGSHNGALE